VSSSSHTTGKRRAGEKRHDHIPTEARLGSAATHAIRNGLPATVMLTPTLRAAILPPAWRSDERSRSLPRACRERSWRYERNEHKKVDERPGIHESWPKAALLTSCRAPRTTKCGGASDPPRKRASAARGSFEARKTVLWTAFQTRFSATIRAGLAFSSRDMRQGQDRRSRTPTAPRRPARARPRRPWPNH
jgi:hypothetical protein